MNILVAGAFGHLGNDLVRIALKNGHSVLAMGREIREIEGVPSENYTAVQADIVDSHALKGICNGIDVVIDAIGLTHYSKTENSDDVDFNGNKNLLQEAKRSNVKKFVYISILNAAPNKKVPLVNSKFLFEEELKKSHLDYLVVRPSGYFYDIANVFVSMIQKGTISLLGKKTVRTNPISTEDLAAFILEHLEESRKILNVGGKETYSYEEIARIFLVSSHQTVLVKHTPIFVYNSRIFSNKISHSGKSDIFKFSKWTLTHDMVSDSCYGDKSFKEYIDSLY